MKEISNEKAKLIGLDIRQYGMLIALIAIFILFYILSGGTNASPTNINNLIMQNGYVVILSVGMLLCVLTGNIDLGVGSVVALCGAFSAIIVVDLGFSVWVAFFAALFVGGLSGIFVGFFIAELGIPPFVVTLATMLMGRGLTYTVLKAQTKGPLPPAYTKIGIGYLPSYKIQLFGVKIDCITLIILCVVSVLIVLSVYQERKKKRLYNFAQVYLWQEIIKIGLILFVLGFFFIKIGMYRGIPNVLILISILIFFYHFLTSNTVAGRQIYALGGNAKAARLSGVNIKKVYFLVYANMGLLSGLAGIVLSARNASATPKAGDGFELDAIAACYIGGAATSGGVGTVIGAVVGAFIMGILNNGMSLMGLSTDIQKIVKGLVLLGAVTVDLLNKRKKG